MTDQVYESIANLAKEVICPDGVNLIEFDRDPPFVRPHVITERPKHKDFISSLEQDKQLCILFPDDDEKKLRIRTFRPKSLASRFINGALWHAAHQNELTLQMVLSIIQSFVNDLRTLAAGNKIKVPTWVCFCQGLEENTVVNTRIGTLRNWRLADRYLQMEQQQAVGGSIFTTWTEQGHDISSTAKALHLTTLLRLLGWLWL